MARSSGPKVIAKRAKDQIVAVGRRTCADIATIGTSGVRNMARYRSPFPGRVPPGVAANVVTEASIRAAKIAARAAQGVAKMNAINTRAQSDLTAMRAQQAEKAFVSSALAAQTSAVNTSKARQTARIGAVRNNGR